jgi:REP element-mobilizing transposase RayT
MASELRVFVPDGIYHVASRGSDRRPLFTVDDDREIFMYRLERMVDRFELSCVAYCLMGNHYHLIVQTPGARLSAALQELHRGYSRQFNRIHGRSAHLFRNRFMAQLIDTDAYLLTALRRVLRAGSASAWAQEVTFLTHLRLDSESHPIPEGVKSLFAPKLELRRSYSTVTVLARFRGWSTLRPWRRAIR